LFCAEFACLSQEKKLQNIGYLIGAHIFIGALLISKVLQD